MDGKDFSWNNPSAPVTITVPYTLTSTEASNAEFLTVWYIDGNSKPVAVPSARYNAATKSITFSTTHFSKYALVYNETTFSDISSSFAKKGIEVLAAKGITSGTGKNAFSPKANITRADFLVMLVKALGLNADFDSNFSDIKSTDYFYNAVGIAKKLGITSGSTNGNFNPRANISRQDMMVMAVKALKIVGKLTASDADVNKFTDAASISAYAKDSIAALVSSGIVSGNNGEIDPTSSATREQIAIVIYKIYNK
ncbi:MAG: S-layer homology domain-containing protein [Ruminiclostridium sp.]